MMKALHINTKKYNNPGFIPGGCNYFFGLRQQYSLVPNPMAYEY
jgi:hypothetical protein